MNDFETSAYVSPEERRENVVMVVTETLANLLATGTFPRPRVLCDLWSPLPNVLFVRLDHETTQVVPVTRSAHIPGGQIALISDPEGGINA